MTDIEREDAAIERAAMALAWDARPVVFVGHMPGVSIREWWERQKEVERRLWLRRARVAIEIWESAHA